MRLSALLLASISLMGCLPGTGVEATRFACGVVDLLVEATDLDEIKKAFGADEIQDKVCAIFAVSDRTVMTEPQILSAELPTGVEVRAEAQPSGGGVTK